MSETQPREERRYGWFEPPPINGGSGRSQLVSRRDCRDEKGISNGGSHLGMEGAFRVKRFFLFYECKNVFFIFEKQ